MSNKIDRMTLFQDFDIFWNKESQFTEQRYITTDTRGIIVDYLEQALKTALNERNKELLKWLEEYKNCDHNNDIKINKQCSCCGTVIDDFSKKICETEIYPTNP